MKNSITVGIMLMSILSAFSFGAASAEVFNNTTMPKNMANEPMNIISLQNVTLNIILIQNMTEITNTIMVPNMTNATKNITKDLNEARPFAEAKGT